MKAYLVDGYARWFVVRCPNKRIARREGVDEFGRDSIKEIREATDDEVRQYRRQRGADEETITE